MVSVAIAGLVGNRLEKQSDFYIETLYIFLRCYNVTLQTLHLLFREEPGEEVHQLFAKGEDNDFSILNIDKKSPQYNAKKDKITLKVKKWDQIP